MMQNKPLDGTLPDVAALYLDEALTVLGESGFSEVHVEKTIQPRERDMDFENCPDMSYRVVHCELSDEKKVVLTVTAAREIRGE